VKKDGAGRWRIKGSSRRKRNGDFMACGGDGIARKRGENGRMQKKDERFN